MTTESSTMNSVSMHANTNANEAEASFKARWKKSFDEGTKVTVSYIAACVVSLAIVCLLISLFV
jgi:hypothetical protein